MPDVGYFVRYFFLEWEQLEIYKSRGGIQMKYVFPEYKENVVLGNGKTAVKSNVLSGYLRRKGNRFNAQGI